MHTSSLGVSMRRIAVTAFLCLAVVAPAFAGSHPALWKAQDADTTVYLFGTIHAMKEGVPWHFPALDQALDASTALYIEAANVNPKTVQPLVMKYGLDPAHPLSAKLSKKENAQLKEIVAKIGIPGGMTTVNMMKPWLVGITLASAPLIKAGYDPKLGVDKQLQAQFEKAEKPVKGLETAKQQILFFAKLPEPVQLKFLQKSLHDYAHADSILKKLMHAWKHGDVKTLTTTVISQLKDRSPKLYEVIILNRNKNWSQQIAKLMATTPGTVVIAVGTGHLVGPDRVQAQLQDMGIQTARVHAPD